MTAKPNFSKVGFIKSYLLPVFITFLIPGFALWFFDYVEAYYDAHIRESVLSQIRGDQRLTDTQRRNAVKFYESVSVSEILASSNPEAKPLQDNLENVRTRYAVFRWMKRIAFICLVTGGAAFVAAGIGVLISFWSRNAQYWRLRLAWTVLRLFALIEVLGQGALAVALSFWITAFWMEQYYPKLIVIAAILALCAAVLLIAAIFRKLQSYTEFSGRLLKWDAAPSLWQRLSQMAERLGIAPPDNIFVGI